MSTSDAKPTEKQTQVLTYLKDHRINDELNIIVNRLCHAQTEDPFAFMVKTQTSGGMEGCLIVEAQLISPSAFIVYVSGS